MKAIVHMIVSGATIGILFVATALFFTILFLRRSDSSSVEKFYRALLITSATGTLFAAAAFLSGYFGTWSSAAISFTLLAHNKVIISWIALAAWGSFVTLLWQRREGIFCDSLTRAWSTFLVIVGAISAALLGSMGGSAILKGTALEPILQALDLNRYTSVSDGLTLVALLAIGAIIAIGTGMACKGCCRAKQ